MIMVSFRSKKDKEHLLDKARKMAEYSDMIVECLEESDYDGYNERSMDYRHEDDDEMHGRYGYRKYRMR